MSESLSLHEARKLEKALAAHIDSLVGEIKNFETFPVAQNSLEITNDLLAAQIRFYTQKETIEGLIETRFNLRDKIQNVADIDTKLSQIAKARALSTLYKTILAPLNPYEGISQLKEVSEKAVQQEIDSAVQGKEVSHVKIAIFPDTSEKHKERRTHLAEQDRKIASLEAAVGALNHSITIELTESDMARLKQAQLI